MNWKCSEMESESRHAKLTGIVNQEDYPLITFGDVGAIFVLSFIIGLAVGFMTIVITFIYQVIV